MLSALTPTSLLLTSLALAHATEEFRLFASDGVAGDRLGADVDVHDDTIIAGAPGADANGNGSGAAYVFFYDGTDYAEQQKLLASDGLALDAFGTAVAVNGDTAVVGAPGSDTNGSRSGAAYVFVRSGTSWTQQAKITQSTPTINESFGTSVAVYDDTIVVGAPGLAAAGSAFVFERTGTTWTEQAELTASDAIASNRFGRSVDLREDIAIVGAELQNGLVAGTGAAYVYSRTGTSWAEDQKLQADDGQFQDQFGFSVAINENGVMEIGAPGDDDFASEAGAAYRFTETGGVWNQDMKRLGITGGDALGTSVDISHNFTITGAHNLDAGQSNTGAGVLWFLTMPNLAQVFLASESQLNMQLGKSVACDECWMVAGATGDPFKGTEAGAVYVFETLSGSGVLSNGSFVNPVAMTTIEGPNIGQPWTVEFDTSSHPTTTITDILIYRFFASTPINSQWGEILLQLSGPRLLWSSVVGTGTVQHVNVLPPDPSYVGLSAAAQGMMRNSSQILTLTNGEFIRIGCFGQ